MEEQIQMAPEVSAFDSDTADTKILPAPISELLEKTSIESLTVEIKFYLNQMGQNAIEVGKRLIAAKELVPHGQWQAWLEDNFQLKKSSAANFMNVAKRFASNFQTSGNLNQ